jgi:hypothetical protein
MGVRARRQVANPRFSPDSAHRGAAIADRLHKTRWQVVAISRVGLARLPTLVGEYTDHVRDNASNIRAPARYDHAAAGGPRTRGGRPTRRFFRGLCGLSRSPSHPRCSRCRREPLPSDPRKRARPIALAGQNGTWALEGRTPAAESRRRGAYPKSGRATCRRPFRRGEKPAPSAVPG